jgi:hypothetical protein
MDFGVRYLRRLFLRLRRKLKLWIRVWARKSGRVEVCAVLGLQLQKLNLFSRVYGEELHSLLVDAYPFCRLASPCGARRT